MHHRWGGDTPVMFGTTYDLLIIVAALLNVQDVSLVILEECMIEG